MLTVKTKLGPSSVHGVGLFANQPIPKGSIVHRCIDGFDRFFTADELSKLPQITQDYIRHYGYISKATSLWVINFDDIKFTNHSKSPNIAPGEAISGEEPHIVALRDIAAGEELLEDYTSFSTNAEEHGL